MFRYATLVLLIFCLTQKINAKPSSGLTSESFLGKPVGARFVGVGLAGVSLPGTPESPVYNPASLSDVKVSAFSIDTEVANQSRLAQEVVFSQSSLRDKKLTYLGFAGSNRAIFYRPLTNFDETVVTSTSAPSTNYKRNDVQVNQFGISASQTAEKGYDVGLTVSYLNARRGYMEVADGQAPILEMANGNGFSVDWGFRDTQGPLAYGLSLLNLPGILYWDEYKKDQLPTTVRAGFTFQPTPTFAFITEYEKRFYVNDKTDPDFWHFGVDVLPLRWLSLRGGAESEDFNNQNKTAYTWGVATSSAKGLTLDIASRARQILEERVYEYYLTLTWPLPS